MKHSHKLLLLFLIILQPALFGQQTDSLTTDKHKRTYTIIGDIKEKEGAWATRKSPGGQIGYSNFGGNQVDLGINYYWSKMKTRDHDDLKDDVYHTFGPSLAGILLIKPTTTVVGTQVGLDYHYYYSICPRLNVLYENYFNGDQRIGIDAGFSILGIYSYVGYHYPVGIIEDPYLSRFRFGFRFIFNQALKDAAFINWH